MHNKHLLAAAPAGAAVAPEVPMSSQELGQLLYPMVATKNADHAGKITEMQLKQTPDILPNLLINTDALLEKIIEAELVLQLAQQAQQAQ